MSPTIFKLALAAVGTAAVLWSLPRQLAEEQAHCKACAPQHDLPGVSKGTITKRRILL